MERELTCIRCPIGCQLRVSIEGEAITVTGNSCPRGKEYGIKEVTNPTRTVTSSVRIEGGTVPVLSVKTKTDVGKEKIFDVMEKIHKTKATAPVHIGDVIIRNVAGTGCDFVATKTVEKL